MKRLAVALLLSGCTQLQRTAEKVQTLDLHPIAPAALELARDTRCDDQPTTYAEAMAALPVPIVETRITRGMQTATPKAMLAARGFSKRPETSKLRTIRHELVHYCQRETVPCFDILWLTGSCNELTWPRSDYRVGFETAAYRVSYGALPGDMVVDYLAHDLDPGSWRALGEAVQR